MIGGGFDVIVRRLAELETEQEQLRRRLNNVLREARVTEVDAAQGLVRVDAGGLPSAAVPWLERAGAIRQWAPPSVGERVLLLSPTGEPGQGLALMGGFSDQFPAPSADPTEQVIEVEGKARVSIKPGRIKHSMKDGSFAVIADGFAKIKRGQHYIAASATGLFASGPITLAADPFPDD